MPHHIKICLLLFALLAGESAFAKDGIDVSGAWARATVPGQVVGSAYMNLTSTKPAKLIKVESPVAGTAEIHFMRMKGDVMEMRELQELDLPAGKTVTLAPGGFHLMLFDLKHPLKTGETVPIKLTIRFADNLESVVEIAARVKPGH
jgi:periplasmic copper chaperone A